VWTHHLKDFEYIPDYRGGQAARVSAGLEAWEVFGHMFANNISIVAPRDGTIGVYGGWTAGGGHNVLASAYGLGADQVLSLQAVTADGRFVTADEDHNQDLFYAMRGGGGCKSTDLFRLLWWCMLTKTTLATYGILTSAIVRAYPPLEIRASSFSFTSGNNTEAFWSAINEYYWFQQVVCEGGGAAYDNIIPTGGSFLFNTEIEMPFKSSEEIKELLQPMFNAFNESGIFVANPEPRPSQRWILPTARDVRPGNTKFASRLFPRKFWRDKEAFHQMMVPVRDAVEGGYVFHGIHMWAKKPDGIGDNGVNAAFRESQMHTDLFDSVPPTTVPRDEFEEANTRFESYMNAIRAATPGGGAYYNEADTQEPKWQESFFGRDNYKRLLNIKKKRDPWSVFWAPQTVGSEGWEIKSDDYFPSQNGPLCRVKQ